LYLNIKSGIETRKNCVVALMKLDLALRGLVNSKYLVKKVLDRVHYLFQQCSTVLPEELPEETSSMRTAAFVQTIPEKPPSSIKSGKLQWSKDETRAIFMLLTSCDKYPNNDEIKQLLKKRSELITVLKSNKFE